MTFSQFMHDYYFAVLGSVIAYCISYYIRYRKGG